MATVTKDAEISMGVVATDIVSNEFTDPLARGGGPEAVIAFRPSKAAHARLYKLMAREKGRQITDEETRELDHYLWLEHLIRMAKIRARLLLQEREKPEREAAA